MFPEKIAERENYIFDRVTAGAFEASWTTVTHCSKDRTIKFQIMEDALKIDGIRVNVSATLQQKLADIFDASLMTAQVADLAYISASRKLLPAPMPISTSVASMVKHSHAIDAQLKSFSNLEGLIADPGKHWILDKKLETNSARACNYGWHFTGPTYKGIAGFPVASKLNTFESKSIKVIQPNAIAHDAKHSDYSQICQLVSQTCWVDGIEKRFSELLIDPVLSSLVSHQGPLKFVRQPGVPEIKGQIVLFPTVISLTNIT